MREVKTVALLGAASAFVLGVVALSFVVGQRFDAWEDVRPPVKKEYGRTLVEGLRVGRHGLYGVDLVTCKSCRLQKRKHGIFTLGAMNVLVIDDLSVVLPRDDGADSAAPGEGDADIRALARRLGVSDGFLSGRGVAPKFSGLKINGLSVSRLTDENKPAIAFTARSAEAVRGGLRLSGCIVHGDAKTSRPVSGAMLARSDRKLRLTWNGGQMILN